jgi:hypothetical protein
MEFSVSKLSHSQKVMTERQNPDYIPNKHEKAHFQMLEAVFQVYHGSSGLLLLKLISISVDS